MEKKNTKKLIALQEIENFLDCYQGKKWEDIAETMLARIKCCAPELPLIMIDICPLTQFVFDHDSAKHDVLDPDNPEIPYMRWQLELIRNTFRNAAAPLADMCDDTLLYLDRGVVTTADMCVVIISVWSVYDKFYRSGCRDEKSHSRPAISLLQSLIKAHTTWPEAPDCDEKKEVTEILKAAITKAKEETESHPEKSECELMRGYEEDDIVF